MAENEALQSMGASKNLRMCNPVIRKMAKKVDAQAVQEADGKVASYQGVGAKTAFFLVMCVVGIILYFVSHNALMAGSGDWGGPLEFGNPGDIIHIKTCVLEFGVFMIAGVIVLFAPLLAWLIRPIIPVVGVLYAICEGYFMGAITEMLADEYKWISFVAFALTIVIVAVMLFLYVKRIVKVTQKFKTVVTVLFASSIIGGILMFLLSLIPFLKPIIDGITSFMGNPIVGIIGALFYVIVAAMFLLVDFDTIENCVNQQMPKKLEWMAAFGLVYTVIFIYFKILSLIMQVVETAKGQNGAIS